MGGSTVGKGGGEGTITRLSTPALASLPLLPTFPDAQPSEHLHLQKPWRGPRLTCSIPEGFSASSPELTFSQVTPHLPLPCLALDSLARGHPSSRSFLWQFSLCQAGHSALQKVLSIQNQDMLIENVRQSKANRPGQFFSCSFQRKACHTTGTPGEAPGLLGRQRESGEWRQDL